jgi:NADH-quinone oxidoreductase subunit L
VGILTAFLTALYAFRMVFVVFLGHPRDKELFDHAHEAPRAMTIPLVILGVLAIIGGLLNLPGELVGAERLGLMNNMLEHTLGHPEVHGQRWLQWVLLGVSGLLPLIALLLAQNLWGIRSDRPRRLSQRYAWLYSLLVNKYYVDELYMAVIVNPLKQLGAFLADTVDQQAIDGAVNKVASVLRQSSERTRRLQTGYVRNYALGILLGVVAVIGYLILR